MDLLFSAITTVIPSTTVAAGVLSTVSPSTTIKPLVFTFSPTTMMPSISNHPSTTFVPSTTTMSPNRTLAPLISSITTAMPSMTLKPSTTYMPSSTPSTLPPAVPSVLSPITPNVVGAAGSTTKAPVVYVKTSPIVNAFVVGALIIMVLGFCAIVTQNQMRNRRR